MSPSSMSGFGLDLSPTELPSCRSFDSPAHRFLYHLGTLLSKTHEWLQTDVEGKQGYTNLGDRRDYTISNPIMIGNTLKFDWQDPMKTSSREPYAAIKTFLATDMHAKLYELENMEKSAQLCIYTPDVPSSYTACRLGIYEPSESPTQVFLLTFGEVPMSEQQSIRWWVQPGSVSEKYEEERAEAEQLDRMNSLAGIVPSASDRS